MLCALELLSVSRHPVPNRTARTTPAAEVSRKDAPPPLPPPGDRWGRRATTGPPPPRAACREPEPLPVALGFRTPTPVGPRENRSEVTRALPELVVPSAAALHSRKPGRAGARTTEAKVRVAGRGQSAPAWGWR